MTNAIEVLKSNIPKFYDVIRPMKLTKDGKYEPDNSEKEFWDAVKTALLALHTQAELEVLQKRNAFLQEQTESFDERIKILLKVQEEQAEKYSKAIMALEKQVQLKEWLEKEIETDFEVINLSPRDVRLFTLRQILQQVKWGVKTDELCK